MDTDEISIPEPCDADWTGMSGDERQRFCGACDKHVTDLSALTEERAQAFVRDNPDACVRYSSVGKKLQFDSARPRSGLRRVLGVGLLLSLGGGATALASGQSGQENRSALVDWVASWVLSPVVATESYRMGLIAAPGVRPPAFDDEEQETKVRPPVPVLSGSTP